MVERVLILGGTAEAADLATKLVAEGKVDVLTSLAGRTANPAPIAGTVRIGGFGGAEGLASFLAQNRIDRVIDATHPFATRISENARIACQAIGIPLEHLDRPSWTRSEHDDWTEVETLEQAAAALPSAARAFLALGRQHLAAFKGRDDCHFVIRMVDPPPEPMAFRSFDLILGKPSSDPQAEADLLSRHGITHLVCRNSGGNAGYGKILAARQLGLPVIILKR